jgi:hypothetical protein
MPRRDQYFRGDNGGAAGACIAPG